MNSTSWIQSPQLLTSRLGAWVWILGSEREKGREAAGWRGSGKGIPTTFSLD
jgi:hypothetical protein